LALLVFVIVYHARFASPVEEFIQIASHLTFLHTLSPLTFGAISGPLWTIGVEVQFYLLFPLLCAVFRKSPLWSYAALLAFSETYRTIVGHAGLGSSFLFINQLPAYLDIFGSGMFGAYAFTVLAARDSEQARRLSTVASLAAFAVAIAGLAEVSAIARDADSNAAYDWVNANRVMIGPLCVVLALSTSFAVGRWRSVLTTRVSVFLSMISYNLYLWNLEIAVWYHQAGFGPAATFVLSIGSAIILSTAITYAIERPILEADLRAVWKRAQSRIWDRGQCAREAVVDAQSA
jgi:peptidoglycan/LPS O-acetylase OafA/YrhL